MLQLGIFSTICPNIDLRTVSDMDLGLKSVYQQGNYMQEGLLV
jgi:hypothetical protein